MLVSPHPSSREISLLSAGGNIFTSDLPCPRLESGSVPGILVLEQDPAGLRASVLPSVMWG